MNQGIIVLIAVLVLGAQSALAFATERRALTTEEKREIAWAIQILRTSKALAKTYDQKIQIKASVIDELRADGLLTNDDSRLSGICIDPRVR